MAYIERRTDCESFESKEYPDHNTCSFCQTDGHYLCSGCRHIAPFEYMDESDNRMRYYPKQEKQKIIEDNKHE